MKNESKMKNLIAVSMSVVLLTACSSSTVKIENGIYHAIISSKDKGKLDSLVESARVEINHACNMYGSSHINLFSTGESDEQSKLAAKMLDISTFLKNAGEVKADLDGWLPSHTYTLSGYCAGATSGSRGSRTETPSTSIK